MAARLAVALGIASLAAGAKGVGAICRCNNFSARLWLHPRALAPLLQHSSPEMLLYGLRELAGLTPVRSDVAMSVQPHESLLYPRRVLVEMRRALHCQRRRL